MTPQFLHNRKTVALILVIAALALSTPLYISYNYYQNDPRFCTTCHLMNKPYELWHASAMHDVTCHNCHELSPPEALNLVYMTVIQNPTNVTKHAEVRVSSCIACHTSGDITIPQITEQVGHQVHFFQGNVSCLQCHSTTLHQFTPPDSICSNCHTEKQKTIGMASLDCKDCHTYTATGKVSLIPDRVECLSCHSQRATVMAIPAAAHQDSSCSTCHQVHNSSKPLDCTTCHPRNQLPGLHQFAAHNLVGNQTDCQKCHVPHQNLDVRQVCTSCHSDKVNHNQGIECNLCHKFTKTA